MANALNVVLKNSSGTWLLPYTNNIPCDTAPVSGSKNFLTSGSVFAALKVYKDLGLLGEAVVLPNGTNLNDVKSGCWFGYNAYSYTNLPDSNAEFFLETINSGGIRLIQRFTDRNNTTFIRRMWGTDWSAWSKVLKSESPIITGEPQMTGPPDITDSSNRMINSWWVHSLLANRFAKSVGDVGYQKIFGGLIIQWGYLEGKTDAVTVSFPSAFPAACRGILATACNGAGVPGASFSVAVGRLGAAQFSIRGSATGGAYWWAIGY